MAKKSKAMTIEEVTKRNKAGARSASLPSALPALQMPKLKTPAKTSGTQMPVLGKTTSKGIGIVQSVANGSGTQSSGEPRHQKVKTVKPPQQSATDRAANVRAFGAGDYSGGGELLEKAYKTARAAVKRHRILLRQHRRQHRGGHGQPAGDHGEGGVRQEDPADEATTRRFYEQALKTGVNPRTGKRLTVDEKSRYYKVLNTQYTDGKIAQMENVYKDATANQKARTMEAANAAFAASDRMKRQRRQGRGRRQGGQRQGGAIPCGSGLHRHAAPGRPGGERHRTGRGHGIHGQPRIRRRLRRSPAGGQDSRAAGVVRPEAAPPLKC